MIFKNMLVSKLMQSLLDKVTVPEAEKSSKVFNKRNMETSPEDVITAHNSSVKTRQVKRSTERLNKKLDK
jgi:hypothetical protein